MAYLPLYLNSKNARGNSWRKEVVVNSYIVVVNLLPAFSSVFTIRKETRDQETSRVTTNKKKQIFSKFVV